MSRLAAAASQIVFHNLEAAKEAYWLKLLEKFEPLSAEEPFELTQEEKDYVKRGARRLLGAREEG